MDNPIFYEGPKKEQPQEEITMRALATINLD
jgi:hypothetical protein